MLGLKAVSGQLKKAVSALLDRKVIEFTIQEKPGSRLQKYRLTAKGIEVLGERGVPEPGRLPHMS